MRFKKQLHSLIGFFLLSISVVLLLIFTVYEAWVFHSAGGLVALIVLIGAIIMILREGQHIWHSTPKKAGSKHLLFDFLAVLFGGILAFFLTHDLGLGAVVAASLVGILAYLVVPKYGVPAYCGAFVGMTSNLLLFNYPEVGLAGFVAGIVFILTRDVFNGFGGKLGTIALIGTTFTGMSLGREFLLTLISDWSTNALIILIAAIATPLTFYLNIERKQGPVLASATVGLIGGLILPNLFPQYGTTLAVVAICASFAGMTGKERCSTFWHIFITGLFTGIVFLYSAPLLGGAGGKLGTIAFGATLSSCGYTWLFKRYLTKSPSLKTNKNDQQV